jgi:hypothetical protein
MRLINTKTLRLREFIGQPPPYAILSHTWGRNEVSIHDFHDVGRRRRQRGFAKIQKACLQARRDALEYAWVDTCCIDKSSSAELSEAINSMFEWYRRSEVCYAYLEDVPPSDLVASGMPLSAFAASRWFRRGWTLQELLAPSHVRFFNNHWEEIGDRGNLSSVLEDVTGIEKDVLSGGTFSSISVGRRMSWASQRETTRPEDVAYSLLGIFDVNMPLLYGEGDKAFIRLQEEIMKKSEDQSILAWQDTPESAVASPIRGILAKSPRDFANFRMKPQSVEHPHERQIIPFEDHHAPKSPVALTNRGLRVTAVFEDLEPWKPLHSIKLGLNCIENEDLSRVVAIYLERQGGDRYVRVRPSELTRCRSYGPHTTIYGLQTLSMAQGDGLLEPSSNADPVQSNSTPSGDTAWLSSRRRLLQHAIFVENTTIGTSHGMYRVVAMISPEAGAPSGLLRFHPLDPSPEGQPLVIPTTGDHRFRHPRFRGAIVLRGRFGSIYVLLVFGTVWNPTTLEYDCWLDAVILGPDAVHRRDQTEVLIQEAVLGKVNGTKRPNSTADSNSKTLSVGVFEDKSCHLSIGVRLRKVQGIDMFCIDVRELSPFPDPRRKDLLTASRL